MRNSYKLGAAVGTLATAFTMLAPVTAQASQVTATAMPAAVMPATAAQPGIGIGREKLGLPAQQGTLKRSNFWCDDDDWWRCRDFDDFGFRGYGDFDRFGRFGDFDRFGRGFHRDWR